jgi:hypothetical protein
MARNSISPRLPKGLLGFHAACDIIKAVNSSSYGLIKILLAVYIFAEARFTNNDNVTAKFCLHPSIPVAFMLHATAILCIYGWGLSKYQVGIILGLCKRETIA